MKKIFALVLILSFFCGCAQQPQRYYYSSSNISSQTSSAYEEVSSVIPSLIPSSSEASSKVSSQQPSSVAPSLSEVSSEQPSSVTPSSSEVSSVQSQPTHIEKNGIKYFNVAASAKGQSSIYGNDDAHFPKGEEGYYIEKGTYKVSAETFWRVIKMPFYGSGAIKLADWSAVNYTPSDIHVFDGVIPISKMNDPLFVSMNAPNECKNYYSSMGHNNGGTCVPAQEKHTNVVPIGAVYLNDGCTLSDDTEITLCFSRLTMAIKYKGQAWKNVHDYSRPASLNRMYPLPWQLEFGSTLAKPIIRLPDERIRQVDGHWEITFKIGDFKRKEGEDSALVGRVFHFWGQRYYLEAGTNGTNIEGLAANYQVWVKEPQYAGVLSGDVGVDMRDRENNVNQSFASRSFAITNEKRNIFGHNVCPLCYDKVMDSAEVQKLLGMI